LSSKFIASLKGTSEHHTNGEGLLPDTVLEEARNLASCTFEKGTKWGNEEIKPKKKKINPTVSVN